MHLSETKFFSEDEMGRSHHGGIWRWRILPYIYLSIDVSGAPIPVDLFLALSVLLIHIGIYYRIRAKKR